MNLLLGQEKAGGWGGLKGFGGVKGVQFLRILGVCEALGGRQGLGVFCSCVFVHYVMG